MVEKATKILIYSLFILAVVLVVAAVLLPAVRIAIADFIFPLTIILALATVILVSFTFD